MYQASADHLNDCMVNMNLINTFRKLWSQHVMWTRSFIISTLADLKDLEPVTKRLLRNPSDFADVLRKYYGDENAKKFEALLQQHLLIGAKIVNAAKVGNTAEVNEQEKNWYANADSIAGFLAAINPFWSKSEWQRLLYDHLKMTTDEVLAWLSGQYQKSIDLYSAIEDEALMMADAMADGIRKQFGS
jgi:hypothetical protein